jgi:hypothetical protein
MDIQATSLFAQQQASTQLQLGQAVLKSGVKAEQQTAAILDRAISAAGSSEGTRGTKLDILV